MERKQIIGSLGRAAAIVAASVLTFALIEGCASLVIGLRGILRTAPTYQDYDPLLGWVGRANLDAPDFFGPGKDLRIDARGFRSGDTIRTGAVSGAKRLVCTGDSFTFGEGVADDETWCHLLQARRPGTTSINMGQSGYGVDQAYLRYMRDGHALEHDILVFAFTGGDFERMGVSAKWNTGKPVLRLEGGELVPANVPVPRLLHWLARKNEAADLRVVRLAGALLSRLAQQAPVPDSVARDPAIASVAQRVFENLREANAQKGRRTLFVYLPTENDLSTDGRWRTWTAEVLRALDAELLDLTPAMRELPAGQIARFFIPYGRLNGGHYTEEGNRWVAEVLGQRLGG